MSCSPTFNFYCLEHHHWLSLTLKKSVLPYSLLSMCGYLGQMCFYVSWVVLASPWYKVIIAYLLLRLINCPLFTIYLLLIFYCCSCCTLDLCKCYCSYLFFYTVCFWLGTKSVVIFSIGMLHHFFRNIQIVSFWFCSGRLKWIWVLDCV